MFTGHDLAEGGIKVLHTLAAKSIKASFFLTGDFLRNPAYKDIISKLKRDQHYVSAHSDKHLLYSDWTDRKGLLVTKDSFERDLKANFKILKQLGFDQDQRYYIPPYEWYNADIVRWSKEMGYLPVNYTAGLRTAADYTYPEMRERYLSSDAIEKGIWLQEEKPNGLNGFIILIHMGTDVRRKDKFYDRLGIIIDKLKLAGYHFVDLPKLLAYIKA